MNKPSSGATITSTGTQVVTLADISPHAAKAIKEIGSVRKLPDGKILLLRGQLTHAAYVVLSGRLRATVSSIQGEEQLLRWLEPGEVIGLSCVIANSPYPNDMTSSGATEVLIVERERLISLIRSDAEVGLALIAVLSMRVNQLIDTISDTAFARLEEKVWSVLMRLANYNGVPVANGVQLKLSQDEIAHAVAATRQNVNIQLKNLQARGLVQLGYRNIVVLSK
jgi:CRP-like cAMP-binding protein